MMHWRGSSCEDIWCGWWQIQRLVSTYQKDIEWNYFKVTKSFLRVFPSWIKLSSYFKTQGSLENIAEVIRVLKLYFSEPDFRIDLQTLQSKSCPTHYAAEKGYLTISKILVPISVKLDLLDYDLTAYSPFSSFFYV